MPELKSEFLFTLTASVTALHDVGDVPAGRRHVDLLGAGTFEGPRLRGELIAGGIDMKTTCLDSSGVVLDHQPFYRERTGQRAGRAFDLDAHARYPPELPEQQLKP